MIKTCPDTLIVKCSTWNEDTRGMFDYETTRLEKKDLKVNSSGLLVRTGCAKLPPIPTNIKFLSGSVNKLGPDCVCLAQVDVIDSNIPPHVLDNFWIGPPREELENCVRESPWLVVRNLEPISATHNGCILDVGERIRLGKQEFKVLEIQASPKEDKELLSKIYPREELMEADAQDLPQPTKPSPAKYEFAPCKICLADDVADLDNPMISPCQCCGSVKFIHLNCLRRWIKQRVVVTSSINVTTISWKTLTCELCKTPYPFAVYFNGKIHELISAEAPQTPYVVFESIIRNSEDSNGISIVSFSAKSSITIGRNHDIDWKINDVSVSRCHALLHWQHLNVCLEDCNSKYGTLKLPSSPQSLEPGHTLTVQCGRTVCQFSVEKSAHFFSCFGAGCCKGNTKGSGHEKRPAPPRAAPIPCLPSNGKHALLVVRKLSYQRMMQKEERKRKGAKLLQEVRSLEDKSAYLRSVSVNTNQLPSPEGSPTNKSCNNGRKKAGIARTVSAVQNSQGRRATANLGEIFIAPGGDRADDPDFGDC